MFGKIVVIVVLVTLVKNASLRAVEDESTQLNEEGQPWINDRNSTEAQKEPEREIILYLNCSELHKRSLAEDVIQLSHSIIVEADDPCVLQASVIILDNNEFPAYKHAFNITGKKIVMVNNQFTGPEQNHYVVGDNVLLVNNTYQGDLQIHEVAGYEVTAFHNVYDGRYRVQQYAGTSILVFDNDSKGYSFDVILKENSPNLTYDLYPNVLSNCETGAFNNIRQQTEYRLGKLGQETFDLSPMSVSEFLQDVKTGLKIKRPANAPIVKKLEDLTVDRFSQYEDVTEDKNTFFMYDKNNNSVLYGFRI
nr:EP-like protein [Cotesia vestalis bracovirus]